jgi:hypothetical protein
VIDIDTGRDKSLERDVAEFAIPPTIVTFRPSRESSQAVFAAAPPFAQT